MSTLTGTLTAAVARFDAGALGLRVSGGDSPVAASDAAVDRLRRLCALPVLGLLVALCVVAVPGPLGPSAAGVVSAAHAAPSAALPAELAAAASWRIGEGSESFAVEHQGGRLVATGGGIASSFTSAGVDLRTGDAVTRLSLVGVGYGGHSASVPMAAPTADGNGVAYQRGWLREWYLNGPFGLEQGFTLARPPAGRRLGPLTLAVGIGGPVRARRAGSGVVFSSADGRVLLNYAALSAQDAAGRSLPAEIVVRGNRLLLRIWDRGAHYPLTVDPFVSEAKLTAPTSGSGKEIGQGQLGTSIAISSNGTTALVGGPLDNNGAGAAWVFVRKAGKWVLQKKLTLTSAKDKRACSFSFAGELGFGGAVALSSNGNIALISCPEYSAQSGSVWVFVRKGSKWTDKQRLGAPNEGPIGHGVFGASVALSSNGTTALVGGGGRGPGGAAVVFTLHHGKWVKQHEFLPPALGIPGIADTGFGTSVALSASGTTALIGANGDISDPGWAWVFVRSGGHWTMQARLADPHANHANGFGNSVALSSSGSTALVGNPFDHMNDVGVAWVFTRSHGAWSEQAELKAPTGGHSREVGGGLFGWSVALDSNGQEAMIGGPGDNHRVGAAWDYFFQPGFLSRPGSWAFEQKQSVASGRLFGSSVALSGDGATALIGDPNDNHGRGVAWLRVLKGAIIK